MVMAVAVVAAAMVVVDAEIIIEMVGMDPIEIRAVVRVRDHTENS